jgi:holo-[acyl-carrier protein] synthase
VVKPAGRQTHHGLDRRGPEKAGKNHPAGLPAQIDLTITDDFPLAQAIVIISAVPSGLIWLIKD